MGQISGFLVPIDLTWVIFEELIQYIQILLNNAHGSLNEFIPIPQTNEGEDLRRSRRAEGGVIFKQFHLIYNIFVLRAKPT